MKQTKKVDLKFTGERMIPDKNKGYTFYYEHLLRYLFAQQFAKGKSVLDAGCGTGYGSYLLNEAGAKDVLGLDIDKQTIEYASSVYPSKKITFRQHDLRKNIKLEKKFDLITSFEVIEHILEQNNYLKFLKNNLKKDGVFCVSTPNKDTYQNENEFHLKELSLVEFENLLGKHFKHVYLFDQSFYFSNQLTPLFGNNSSNRILNNNYFNQKFNSYYPKKNKKTSRYFVAVCSQKIINFEFFNLLSEEVDGLTLKNGMEGLYSDIRNMDSFANEELNIIKSSKVYFIIKLYFKIKNAFKFKLR